MSEFLGSFIWYDVMTSDTKAAKAFYRSVMGWEMQDFDSSERNYTVLSVGDRDIGGLMPIPDTARARGVGPCWSGYIAVDDVDAYVERIKKSGGALLRGPEDIPGTCRFAVVADPQGAVFLLITGMSGGEMTPVAPHTPGHVDWRELHAADGASAFAFYADLFGWTKSNVVDMSPMGVYQVFAKNGENCGGIMTKMPQTPAPFWLYYFSVHDIDAAAKRVTDAGGKVFNGPLEVPGGGWIVQCLDPQGAMFALVGPRK